MAAAVFDVVEILTQVIEAAAGVASAISGFENISLARKYYDLYNQQRTFYYTTFQAGAEAKLASDAYNEPYYSLAYLDRAATAFEPQGPLNSPATDVAGWVGRHGAMFATTTDPAITELDTDNAAIEVDWVNYLFRFEELWADIRNDARWAHRLAAHNIGIKQAANVEARLEGAVANYSDQISDVSSQLATYANGIAKYAGYRRGLHDPTEDFTNGTKFASYAMPSMQIPDMDVSLEISRQRGAA